MSDLIDRQAALDAVSEYATIWMSYTDDMSASDIAQEAINSAKGTMIRILKEQPTVQPEIIRCKDCRYFLRDTEYGYDWCNRMSGVFRMKSDDFCSKAERRAGMSDWTIFGERLSHIMREYDVSLRELSQRTGITVTTLHRYATCKRVPRVTEILKCSDALGITCDYLLGLSDDPHLTGKGEKIVGRRCDVPERKAGRWMNRPDDIPNCSECGYIPEFNRYIDDYYYSDYCPNCGAKMEVEHDSDQHAE